MQRYEHRKHVWELPQATSKAIDEAVSEYLEHEDYVLASSAEGKYLIDDIDLDELFEKLGLRR